MHGETRGVHPLTFDLSDIVRSSRYGIHYGRCRETPWWAETSSTRSRVRTMYVHTPTFLRRSHLPLTARCDVRGKPPTLARFGHSPRAPRRLGGVRFQEAFSDTWAPAETIVSLELGTYS